MGANRRRRLGIDFGTTHTVVALVDRGNYPVVAFEGGDVFPSLLAVSKEGDLCFGPDAAAVRHTPGWTVLRSFKRLLGSAGPGSEVEVSGRSFRLLDLLTGFLSHLRQELVTRSNASLRPREILEAAISVPANASSAQRFLTLEAFDRAGFDVGALLNEPSAAGFEYAHRHPSTLTSRREYVLVYDLGGGTFDASLLRMSGKANEVITSEGVQRLGGDDFDEAILERVLEAMGSPSLDGEVRSLLLEECSRQKESVGPQTRRFLVDPAPVESPPLAIPIEQIYEACTPLVGRTLQVLERVLTDPERRGGDAVEWSDLAGIYIVGGGGAFPLVPRLLKERYTERRVKRSPHPFAATAMGLAIFLDREAGYTLSERFSRTFGVWREAEAGGTVTFDPIFAKDTALPAAGDPPLRCVRRYRPAHNIGHFRFVECGRVEDGSPDGDITPWDEIRFPFDPTLREKPDLENEAVLRVDHSGHSGPEVEESYLCAAAGTVEVTVTVLGEGFSRSYRLGRPGG